MTNVEGLFDGYIYIKQIILYFHLCFKRNVVFIIQSSHFHFGMSNNFKYLEIVQDIDVNAIIL